MKKLLPILGVVVVVLATCLAAGCDTGVKAYSDPSKMIEINAGTEFDVVISLDSNPSTGYSWVAAYDQTALVLVDQEYKAGDSNLIGAPGTQIFSFKALKSGQTSITMSYQRSWEPNPIQTKVFSVDVK